MAGKPSGEEPPRFHAFPTGHLNAPICLIDQDPKRNGPQRQCDNKPTSKGLACCFAGTSMNIRVR